jgi:hypothetical protein
MLKDKILKINQFKKNDPLQHGLTYQTRHLYHEIKITS